MEEGLPQIIKDLSMILMVAGVVTILFKRLKQPLVLGYIVAGFLAGPHMPYTPTVDDMSSIQIWSQIGVIFIMFSLGLEFSFKKILKMGISPIIAAVSIMTCMMCVGSGVGRLFGWSNMNCLFLGGMLAMSSTTIIYKAFDDLGIRTKKFAGSVMSVLILEDILGILLMVVLSALAVSKKFEGGQLVLSLFQLGFFLLVWFIIGVFLIPLFLRRNSRFINGETLLIVSVGLCFALVVLASNVGYSAAFGAFMMGSILAETVEAERIDKAIGSVKDLFGAIFFVSVGMSVNPSILVEYWLPILVLIVAILLGQSLFGSLSFILSGQNLKDGIQSGFSMAQIGEFAFIIAALGESKGVTGEFLYPVVVAVSIITTFLTPYMIKAAPVAYAGIERLLPGQLKDMIERRAENELPVRECTERSVWGEWKKLLLALTKQIVVYLTLALAVYTLSNSLLYITCISVFGKVAGRYIAFLATLLLIAPFLRAIVMRKNRSEEVKYLRKRGMIHSLLLYLTIGFRFVIAFLTMWYVLVGVFEIPALANALLALALTLLICYSRFIKLVSIRVERTFRQNLGRRDLLIKQQNQGPAYARKLQSRELHIARLTLPESSRWGGKTLMQLQIGRDDNVLIAAILRGELRINIPSGNTLLFPRDIIEVVGDDNSIEQFSQRMNSEVETVTEAGGELQLRSILIDEVSPYLGRRIKDSNIRQDLNCMVIGFEEADGTLSLATANHQFALGDKVWIVEG